MYIQNRRNSSKFKGKGLQQNTQSNMSDSLNIRKMRNNFRDYANNKKSIGGCVGLISIKGIEVGVSTYSGAFSKDGTQKLSILCLDAEYQTRRLAVRGEYVSSNQDTPTGNLKKDGFFC